MQDEKNREWIIAALLLLILALLQIWPAVRRPTWWLWKPGAPASDLAVTHWPNVHFTRRVVWEEGRFPFWRPTIMSGTPFAANPLAALYYPPNWPLLFLPWISPAVGFNLSALFHLVLAGAAMYTLVRHGLGTALWAGLAAAVAYQLSPKLVAHLGAGHVGWVQAWAWLPLVSLCSLKACRSQSGERLRWIVAAAAALAVQFCADVRLAAYTLTAGAFLFLTRIGTQLAGIAKGSSPDSRGRMQMAVLGVAGSVTLFLVIFVGLSACQWLPGLALLPDTTRSNMTLSDAAVWSLPWRYLSGLLLADHGGFTEWMTYVGTSTLALAAAGLSTLWCDRRRRWLGIWLVGLGTLAAWFSLGRHGGLFQALWRIIPGLGLLRVPPRAWVLVVFSATVLAGVGVERLTGDAGGSMRVRRRWKRALLLAIVAFPPMLTLGYWLSAGAPPLNLVAFGLITPLGIALSGAGPGITRSIRKEAGGLSWGRGSGQPAPADSVPSDTAWLGAAAVLLLTLDLLIVDFTLIEARAPEEVFAPGRAAAEWLAKQPGRFRIYSPSYSIPQQLAEKYGLELADGVDPLQLRTYAEYLTRAAGLQPPGNYSVTLPPFPEGEDIHTALRRVSPDAEMLGQLGVRYVAAAFPLPESSGAAGHLHFVERLGDVFVYRNEASSPLPARSYRAVTLADGRELYRYRTWPVVLGCGVSAVTAIGATAWFGLLTRRARRE